MRDHICCSERDAVHVTALLGIEVYIYGERDLHRRSLLHRIALYFFYISVLSVCENVSRLGGALLFHRARRFGCVVTGSCRSLHMHKCRTHAPACMLYGNPFKKCAVALPRASAIVCACACRAYVYLYIYMYAHLFAALGELHSCTLQC